MGAACMMSSALPAATWPLSSTRQMAANDIAAGEVMSERAAKLTGADDGDVGHRWAIVASLGFAEPEAGSLKPLEPEARSLEPEAMSLDRKSRPGDRRLEGHRTGDRAGAGRRRARTSRSPVAAPRALSAARPKIDSAGPGGVETLATDVRRYADVERAVAATVARFGGLDIVVNNAGVGVFVNIADMTPEQWSEVIDTNLTGVFNVCHASIPHLRARGGGFIINISSLAGKNAFVGAGAYCASKSGLNAFSEALMQEVRYDNIRVSYVMPGSVATGFSGGDETQGRGLEDPVRRCRRRRAEPAAP